MKKKSINKPVLSPRRKHQKKSVSFLKKVTSVMNLAWKFIRERGLSMGYALRLAWMNVKLNQALHKYTEVQFVYKKISGEIRKARGTLHAYPLSKSYPQNGYFFRKTKYGNQAYFDLDRNAWRSFVCSNLISVKFI